MALVTDNFLEEWFVSSDGRFRASFADLGEGLSGDYNSDDPSDVPLLRFYIETSDPANVDCDDWSDWEDDGWYYVGSRCTRVNADKVNNAQGWRLLSILCGELDGQTGSVKKILDELSWMDETY